LARGRISDSALKSCSYLLTVCRCQRTGAASWRAGGGSDFRNLFRHSNSKRSLFAFFSRRLANRSYGTYGTYLSFIPNVGVTGLEPVTLRLSSACSNQLSYTPVGWPWVFGSASAVPFSPPGSAAKWRHGDSNPRPIACKATALPTELCPLGVLFRDSSSPGLSQDAGSFSAIPDRVLLRDFFGISKAKTELCATVSDSLSPGFFRRRGLYRSRIHSFFGVAAKERLDLAIDLCPLS
jgi:hypothetical protein